MSTNSTISLEQADGTFETIYVHWDGHVESVGLALQTKYNTPALLQKLIDDGDHSIVDHFGGTISYKVLRGEDCPKRVSPDWHDALFAHGQEYNYVMGLDGVIQCCDKSAWVIQMIDVEEA